MTDRLPRRRPAALRTLSPVVALTCIAIGAVQSAKAEDSELERERLDYELQRQAGHAQMADTMYASTPSASMPPHAAMRLPKDGEDSDPYLYGHQPPSTIVGKSAEETPLGVYRDYISDIVQSKCVTCHVEGGASGHTRLVFVTAETDDHEATNLQRFDDFLAEVEGGDELILNKIRGVGHGGGAQIAGGSVEYEQMEDFLGLLGGTTAVATVTPENLFDTVRIAPGRTVLRRAALILAGRLPTEEEYASIREIGLRAAVRNLMTGPGFHDFLIRASNDRLLTEGETSVLVDDFYAPLTEYQNERVRLCEIGLGGDEAARRAERYLWQSRVQYGARRAPLELIAHVVENDLPYTEILTADYIMANPWSAQAYGSDIQFDDPEDVHEFQPADIASYYLNDGARRGKHVNGCGTYVVEPGYLKLDYPHAGVLNTKAFLQRYPTTATNRNRARARWTYYHFLGIDIEQLAARTIDPDALVDTDNPTLRNPACTACHTTLDPVAGAYQNYADAGHYRANTGGADSLDRAYKTDPPGGQDHFVEARSWQDRETIEFTAYFHSGNKAIGLGVVQTRPSTRFHAVGIDRVSIRTADRKLVARPALRRLGNSVSCFRNSYEPVHLWQGCALPIPFDIPRSGEHRVELEVWDYYHRGVPGPLRIWPELLYREGDTWYRDMLSPGFAGAEAPDADNSLQWLAQQMVADERFAEGAVKFWWPAIFGAEVASPPGDANDADFEARLLAADAQALEVARIARGFRRGIHGGDPYNLKDLLASLVLSLWFRAGSIDDSDPVRSLALRSAGGRRLLTPEELAAKTLAITGFQWGRRKPIENAYGPPINPVRHALSSDYAILYGGIDSDGVTERARELTPVMFGVAKRHAIGVSCPVVLREFYLLPAEERRLFADVDISATPHSSQGEQAIRGNLVALHDKLFGMRVAPSSSEVTAAYRFLEEAWHRKRESQSDRFLDGLECHWSSDEYYQDNIPNVEQRYEDLTDPDHMARTWVVMLAAMLMDYRYLHLWVP